MNFEEVRAGWRSVEVGALFAVKEGGGFFLEPYVHDRELSTVAVVRVFTTEAEAETYRSAMTGSGCASGPLVVERVAIKDLFDQRSYLYDCAAKEYGSKIRIDLSRISDDSWPESVDTIWDLVQTIH